jgi:hypothetical protein
MSAARRKKQKFRVAQKITEPPRRIIDAKVCAGTHDVLILTISGLRYDVAADALARGETPHLAAILPNGAWEKRHTPASITYGAHLGFLAGYLPTSITSVPAPRLFAVRYPGAETLAPTTLTFDASNIVYGFISLGYHTLCIGGVGYFSKRSPIGSVLPALFHESWWDETFGPTCLESAANQVECAVKRIAKAPKNKCLFLYMNMSACYRPNRFHLPGAKEDTPASQRAALASIDKELPALLRAVQLRAPVLTVICSDHGTIYAERTNAQLGLTHPAVCDVPYMETILPKLEAET